MKLHRLGLTLLVVVIGLSFTSCDYTYVWKRGKLDLSTENFSRPPITDRYGKFAATFEIYDRDMRGIDLGREDVVDVRSYKSNFWLQSSYFRSFDPIEVVLSADGIPECRLRMEGDSRDHLAYIIPADQYAYERFMESLTKRLAYRGRVMLYVDGFVHGGYDGIAVDIISENDMDVKARESR